MSEWISVDDLLPRIGTRVLVGWSSSPFHTDGRSIIHDQVVTRELTDDSWAWSDESGNPDDWGKDEQPTHWMPIQKLSAAKAKGGGK